MLFGFEEAPIRDPRQPVERSSHAREAEHREKADGKPPAERLDRGARVELRGQDREAEREILALLLLRALRHRGLGRRRASIARAARVPRSPCSIRFERMAGIIPETDRVSSRTRDTISPRRRSR